MRRIALTIVAIIASVGVHLGTASFFSEADLYPLSYVVGLYCGRNVSPARAKPTRRTATTTISMPYNLKITFVAFFGWQRLPVFILARLNYLWQHPVQK
jgi:hypothetical protein